MLVLPDSVDRSLRMWAKMIAATVRHEMEGFHVEHLNDKQMQELNPIIRNAIFHALRGIWLAKQEGHEEGRVGERMVVSMIEKVEPNWAWEEPRLSDEALAGEDFYLKEIRNGSGTHYNRRDVVVIDQFMSEDIDVFGE